MADFVEKLKHYYLDNGFFKKEIMYILSTLVFKNLSREIKKMLELLIIIYDAQLYA